MATSNGFLSPVANRYYPGSSGYWMGQGSSSPANSVRVPGLGYPGDAARARMGVPTIDPAMNANGTATTVAGRRALGTSASDLLKPYAITKNPALAGLVGDLYGEFGKGGSNIPGFDDYLKQHTQDVSGVNRAFDDQSKAFDLTDYFATQRGADAAATGLTNRYADTSRGMVGAADASTSRYTSRGEVDLAAVLANASDTSNYDKSIQDALAQVGGNMNRSRIASIGAGGSGGDSSGLARYGMREAVRQTLPYRLQQQREVTDVLSRYLPFHGDVASREQNDIRLGLGNEGNIYGAQQGDILRGKGTEQSLQNLKLQVAGMNVDAAIRKLAANGTGIQQMVAVLGLPASLLTEKLRAAGLLGALDDSATWRGVDYPPGANVTDPQGASPNLPNDYPGAPGLPNRYSTETGTSGGDRYGNPSGVRYDLQGSDPNAYFSSLPQWAQNQRRGVPYQNSGRYPYPVGQDPRYVGSGTGYVNDAVMDRFATPSPTNAGSGYTGQDWSDFDY